LNVFDGIGGSRMGKMSQEVGSQKRKGQMQMRTKYEQTANQQLLGSAGKVMGICMEKRTQTLA
jgi:hypothetical protein